MRVISKAAFAREAGVTTSAISKVLNTALKDALNGHGIDADHPAAIKYLSRKRRSGRPSGGSNAEIAKYVVSRAARLRHCKAQLLPRFAPLIKDVSVNIFHLGFAAKWMPANERHERMAFVEGSLELLEEACE